MADKACHVAGYALQFGLTWALGRCCGASAMVIPSATTLASQFRFEALPLGFAWQRLRQLRPNWHPSAAPRRAVARVKRRSAAGAKFRETGVGVVAGSLERSGFLGATSP